jgi:hypothetical protein
MNKFWVLERPEDEEAERRCARRSKGDKIRFEIVQCPIDPLGHRRATVRLTPISAVLPSVKPYDFVWAPWAWACLVQESVLSFLDEAGLKGYETVPAVVRFADASRKAPAFWELKAKGFAGGPSKESGLKVLFNCSGCGLTYYSQIKDPTKFIDETRWDGNDFFRVDPFPSRIFITDRVAQALRDSPLKGWAVYSLAEMKEAFDIAFPGPSSAECAALN